MAARQGSLDEFDQSKEDWTSYIKWTKWYLTTNDIIDRTKRAGPTKNC